MMFRRMARTTTESRTELGFELESFDFTAADRLEVTGRWFGVRGRRFMRPVVNLRVDGRRRRMIAVLDHKPWAADAEGTWIAAFVWRGEHGTITNARLEVSPDMVLDMPAPGDDVAGAILHPRALKREPKKPRAETPPAAEPRAEVAPTATTPAEPAAPPTTPAADAAPAAPPPSTPAEPAAPPATPAAAADAAALADAERRLAGERAERERLEAALRDAEARVAALSEHQESAVERANELVRLEGELAAARERVERVERDRVSAQERGDGAERRLAAFRERAETAERELAAAGERADSAAREVATARERADAAERAAAAARDRAEAADRARPAPAADDQLRRRAESAELDLAAAQERANAAELETASLRRRAESAEPRPVPDAVLQARGVAPRRERGWAARAVGLVWIAVLLIVLVVIVSLVL
jgi:hypothetical protein